MEQVAVAPWQSLMNLEPELAIWMVFSSLEVDCEYLYCYSMAAWVISIACEAVWQSQRHCLHHYLSWETGLAEALIPPQF
jgi:hypothetical protein